MSKGNLPQVKEKGDAFSRVLRFMTKADIALRPEEERILDRWVYCDALLKSRRLSHDEIVDDIVQRWAVSKFTAINDINYTQRLFERCRQVSKKYLLHHHIETIGLSIQQVMDVIKGDKDKDIKADSDKLELLPKLFDSYTKAIQALPDDQVADKQPPPIFQFVLAPGQQLDAPMDFGEAMEAASKILNMTESEDGVFQVTHE